MLFKKNLTKICRFCLNSSVPARESLLFESVQTSSFPFVMFCGFLTQFQNNSRKGLETLTTPPAVPIKY